jgi:hypothetical protein
MFLIKRRKNKKLIFMAAGKIVQLNPASKIDYSVSKKPYNLISANKPPKSKAILAITNNKI